MYKRSQNPEGFQLGDKVHIRSGPHASARGAICAAKEGILKIKLNGGEIVQAKLDEITNYSFAARRAWQAIHGKSN